MGGYLVVRLVPESPVDGATFTTDYLNNLQLQAFDAYTGDPVTDFVYYSPYTLTQWPTLSGYLSLASAVTSKDGYAISERARELWLDSHLRRSTEGIQFGAYLFTNDQNAPQSLPAPSFRSAVVVSKSPR